MESKNKPNNNDVKELSISDVRENSVASTTAVKEGRYINEVKELSTSDVRKTAVASTTAMKERRFSRRTGRQRTPHCSSEAEDLSDCSLVSAESAQSSTTLGSRKRLQTGSSSSEGNKPRKKSAKPPAQKIEGNFQVPLASVVKASSKLALPSAEELSREMAEQPTGDLGSRIVENLEILEKAADNSRNTKENLIHAMKLAVRNIQAATAEMVQRTPSISLEKENQILRSQLNELSGKVEALTAEVTELRRVNGRTQQRASRPKSGERESSEVLLMERIGNLIEGKLAAFKEELFPGRAIRPPLGQKANPSATLQRSTREAKENKSGATTASQAASVPHLSIMAVQSEKPHEEAWSTVVSRKSRAKARAAARPEENLRQMAVNRELENRLSGTPGSQTDRVNTPTAPAVKKGNRKVTPKIGRLPKIPKTAAVTITIPQESTVTYAQAMAVAKERVKLSDIGIVELRQRKALNGGLLLEIAGEACSEKANALAGKLQEVIADMGVKVARPVKLGEARVKDLDDSVTQADVADAIADACECSASDIKVGTIRRGRSSLGIAWVRCPLVAIKKLAAVGRVRVGWVSARVEILSARPLQCFRCLEIGHARHQCTSTIDRSALCYVCGEANHKASQCVAQTPKCMVCAEFGLKADHRLGGKHCRPPKRKGGKVMTISSVRADGPAQVTAGASAHCPSEEIMEQA